MQKIVSTVGSWQLAVGSKYKDQLRKIVSTVGSWQLAVNAKN